jgi:hypothetical protein
VSSLEELELAIRRAQLATLNHSDDPKRYVEMTANIVDKEASRAHFAFSPNPVVVEIRGEDLPNLSFVDLPGIISQSADGYHLVPLVRNLAKHHMEQKNTLILLVISMESDVMNSAASGLVNEVGANDRCVGVLTKPDRRDDSVAQWREVLSGQKFQLELGYFVTKQPSTGQLNIPYDEARSEEMAFFKSKAWKGHFPHASKNEGTRNLQIALSKQLLVISSKSIPEIKTKLQDKLHLIEKRLSRLPEPTKAPRHEIQMIVSRFDRTVDAEFSRYRHDGQISAVRAAWKELLEEFKEEILKELYPKFAHQEDLEEVKKKKRKRVVEQESLPHRASPAAALKQEPDVIMLTDGEDENAGNSTSVPNSPTPPTVRRAATKSPFHLKKTFSY